jgi:dihydrofolate synthase/folylpolyglutamate synthase
MANPIDALLNQYGRFGVHLGLERIQHLLERLGNPHHQVPLIHVAGTNGKGSVCAYLSSVLTQAGYRVGRYTSPHLVDWTERICLNEQPIATEDLRSLLQETQAAIDPQQPSPTQFEVITAAAWLYFAQQQVDVAVVEVGLGGRLDATNVSDRPLVTVITSISREHWQRLGPTLADIAREKAGILKPGCPAVIGPLPAEAKAVVEQRIAELACPAIWPEPAIEVEPGTAQYQSSLPSNQAQSVLQYPLPLPGQHQLANSALAIAALQILQQQGWALSDEAIQQGMAQAKWPGRLQWMTWQERSILIDGAHNPAAAQVLRQYVASLALEGPVTWVMGMLATKDHADIFEALLREGDRLYLTAVPDHESADPADLATLAYTVMPKLAACQTNSTVFEALSAASQLSPQESSLTVLCGSLYLIGHFLQQTNETA